MIVRNKCLCYFLSPDAIAYSGAFFGAGSGPIHLDDVRCIGSEAALINCTYDPSTVDCSHFEDAGVQCQGNDHPLPPLDAYKVFLVLKQ